MKTWFTEILLLRYRGILDILLPVLLVASVCTCWANPDAADKSPSSEPEAVPLPEGTSATGVFTTNSSAMVIKAASGSHYRSLYSWEPGNAPKLMITGWDLDITRLSDDSFAAWYSDYAEREYFVTLDAQKLITPPMKLPKGGPRGWFFCEGDTQTVVCEGDPPGMTVADKDYDEMGFSAVLVIALREHKTTWFPVKHRTRIRFDPAHEMIYAIDWDSPSSHRPATAFDLTGRDLGTASLSDVMPSSPSGRFVESLQEDGAESWDVYEAASMRNLLPFNCERPECKEGDRDDQHWNPKFTDQMVALRTGGAFGKGGECDIYQVLPPHLLKTVPCGGLPVYDWTRDGRALVTIQYEGNIFRRQPVN